MRICILNCFEDLEFRDTGSSTRIFNLAKFLVALGNEVHVLMPGNTEFSKNIQGVFLHFTRGLCPKSILNILGRFLGVAKITALYFYDPVFIMKCSRMIRQSDVVQAEQQVAGGILFPLTTKWMKKPLVIDCHDVFQALRVRHTHTVRRILETFLERLAYRYADTILVVSNQEKNLLIPIAMERKAEVIPNGVDSRCFEQKSAGQIDKHQSAEEARRSVIFVGNLEYLPNQEAVKIISSQIAPKVRETIEDARFSIVGRASKELKMQNLDFLGVVGSVPNVLRDFDVAIAPLLSGSGTRLKILEYLSSGLPVVTTSKGAEGLEIVHGTHAFIEDDMEEFAARVVMLLRDKELAEKIGKAGRELVQRKYDWKIISNTLDAILRKQVENRAQSHRTQTMMCH